MAMATDIVSVVSLHLSTTIGPDCWDRTRPQPIHLTLHLHLTPSFLDTPGNTDNVTDSIHYGQLSKVIERRVGARHDSGGVGYESIRALLEDVTDAAFTFVVENSSTSPRREKNTTTTGNVDAIHALVSLPKQILLAGNFEIELTTPAAVWLHQRHASPSSPTTIPSPQIKVPGLTARVTDLVLPVLIGINPPERLSKQRVLTHLTFHEPAGAFRAGGAPPRGSAVGVNYAMIVKDISAHIENTDYLTLEKLVLEIIKTAFRASDDAFEAVTVCCQKPSALSFAEASAVQMTRRREDIMGAGGLSKSQ